MNEVLRKERPGAWGVLGRSVRLRLVVPISLLLLVACAGAMAAVRAQLLNEMDARLALAIREEVNEFEGLRASIGGEGGTFEIEDDLASLFDTYLQVDPAPAEQQNITLIDGSVHRSGGAKANGYDLASDPQLVRRWARATRLTRGEVDTPRGVVRFLVQPVSLDGRRGQLVAAIYIGTAQREIDRAIRRSAAVILGFLLVGTLFTLLVAGRVVAPLRRLTATARRITDTDLSQRITVTGRDEIADLGRTFNEMLGRLDGAFSAQRLLLRDVGHELRTPLAIAMGHLEFVERDADNRDTLAVVEAEHRRMRRLIDDLLVLARSEQREFLELETVDLVPFTDHLVDTSRTLGERTWVSVTPEAGKIVADPQRLSQAVLNLIDNAVRYTGPGGRIEIGARCRAGRATLWVQDDGPGVPVEERERIFETFVRGASAEPGTGTGLGLAIARRVAVAHGGSISVDGVRGGGARFEISVPIDQPDTLEES